MNRSHLALALPLAASLALGACGGGASVGTTPAPAQGGPAPTPAAATGSGAPAPTAAPEAAAGPIDACALLTADEVAPVVPEPRSSGASEPSEDVASFRCAWSTSVKGKIMALSVNVMDGYVSYLTELGADIGVVEAEIRSMADDPDEPGRVVEGLGDVGAMSYDDYYNQVHVRFLKGDAQVEIQYIGDNAQDAEAKQEAVVALASVLAGRLP